MVYVHTHHLLRRALALIPETALDMPLSKCEYDLLVTCSDDECVNDLEPITLL